MRKQQGSAHLVIIIVLVVALIGTLGFVFWQNFINKSADPDTSTTKTATSTSTTTTDDGRKTFVAAKLGITFTYPSGYTVKEDYVGLNENTSKQEDIHSVDIGVFNKDGIRVAEVGSDFQGGFTCDQDGLPMSYAYRDQVQLTIKNAPAAYYSAAIEGNDGSGYIIVSGLTETSHGAELTKSGCTAHVVSYVPGIDLDQSAPLLNSVAFYGVQKLSFETFAEAEAYLNSDGYKEVSSIIKSFNFQ